jgi:hypothetical protein
MVPLIVSSALFCLVLKLAWAALSLSAKFIAVALYLVVVYVTADFFLKAPGTYPTPKEMHVDNQVRHTKHVKQDD